MTSINNGWWKRPFSLVYASQRIIEIKRKRYISRLTALIYAFYKRARIPKTKSLHSLNTQLKNAQFYQLFTSLVKKAVYGERLTVCKRILLSGCIELNCANNSLFKPNIRFLDVYSTHVLHAENSLVIVPESLVHL